MASLTFPDPVNEVAARTVASGVIVLAVTALVTQQYWLLPLKTYGFLARVLTGPKLSPLGQFASRVVAPRLPAHAKLVPGPPKRFAQAIGFATTLLATTMWLIGEHKAATIFLVLILVAATLESVFAYCIGCKIFAVLMRIGVIPESVCERCNNLSLHT